MTRLIRLVMIACAATPLALSSGWPDMVPPAQAATAQQARASIHWDRVSLGEAVTRLADVLQVDVLVDRRVDPNQQVSLAVRDASIVEILSHLAAEKSLGVTQLGDLLYLGPRKTAGQLRTLAALRQQDVAKLPDDERAMFDRKQAAHWPRLTEPRQLVVDLMRERGWSVRRAELIPHDLWPTGRLPELTLVDQLTVLLAGFDLTFQVLPDQRAVEIVTVDQPVRLARRYRWPAGSPPDVDVLQQQFPDSSVRVDGQSLQVVGRLEDHERLAEMLRSPNAGRNRTAGRKRETRQVFTLHVEDQPAGAILRQLGRQLGLTIEVDDAAVRAAGLSLDRRVTLAVEGVELDELLDAILAPADLDFKRDAQRVRVFPRRSGR